MLYLLIVGSAVLNLGSVAASEESQIDPRAISLSTNDANFSLDALASASTWPRVSDSLTRREVDILALEPGAEAAGALRIRPDSGLLNQVTAYPAAVLWLADNFQSVSHDVNVRGLSTTRTRQLTYQLALWLVTGEMTIEEIRASRFAPLADTVDKVAERSLQEQSPMRSAIQAPAVTLTAVDRRLDGERFQAIVSDGASHDPVAGELVTFYVDQTPVRVMETDGNGIAGPLDLDDRSELVGEVQAVVSVRLSPGTLLSPMDDDNTIVISAQTLGFSASSNLIDHQRVDWLNPATFNLLLNGFLDLLPSSEIRLLLGVGIVAGIAIAGLTGDSLGKGVARGVVSLAVVVVIVMSVGYLVLRNSDSDRIDATWLDPPENVETPTVLRAVRASATTQFDNGAELGVYGPGCALPGSAARTGRPWLSARGAGLPQVLRIDLTEPSVITHMRLEPGWTNGAPEDFIRHPRPVRVDVISDDGVTQRVEIQWGSSIEAASQAEFVDLERPFIAQHVFVAIQAVEGGAKDRGAISEVEFAGGPVTNGEVREPALNYLAGEPARGDC